MDKDELQAREDTRLYPPRFVITVGRSCPAPDSCVVFRFKGATEPIVKEVILTKGMLNSILHGQMLTASLGKFSLIPRPHPTFHRLQFFVLQVMGS